jgi:hypothetical protein
MEAAAVPRGPSARAEQRTTLSTFKKRPGEAVAIC